MAATSLQINNLTLSVNFTENGSAVVLLPSLTISDPATPLLVNATVAITGRFQRRGSIHST